MMKNIFILLSFIPTLLFAQTASIEIGTGAEINIVGDGNANTSLECSGDIIIDGKLNLDNDAVVYIGGDFIRNNSASNAFTQANSTVVFNGTTAQEIVSNTTSTVTETFFNLTVDNPSGVTLNNSNFSAINVRAVLNPISGTLTTNNILVIYAFSPTNYARVAFGSGVVSGDAEVNKNLTNEDAGWRQLSMATSGSLGSDFTDITLNLSNHVPASEINTYKWDASASGTGDYAKGWTAANTGDGNLNGYSVFNDGTNPTFSISDGFYTTGTLNTGDFPNLLQYTRDPADNPTTDDDALGWNLIPNPWPALVDVDVLLADGANFTSGYKAIHVWDAVNNNYRAILASGATKIDYGGNHGTDLDRTTTNIPPMQAFWVKATDNSPSQVCNLIDATMRTVELEDNVAFMKKDLDLLRLNVFDQDSAWDQLVVYYETDATSDFDLEWDGYYLPSQDDNMPIFYGSEEQSRASIIAREANTTDSIPVVFSSTKNQGAFYINTDLSDLEPGWNVYLKDKEENKVYDLRASENLSFVHKTSNNTNRFVLYYSQSPYAFEYLVNAEEKSLISFLSRSSLVIQSNGISGPVDVNITDIYGHILFTDKTNIEVGERLIYDLERTNNFIFVETVLNGKKKIEKLFY